MRILPVSNTLVFSFDKLIFIFATCRFRYRKVIVYFIGRSVLRFFYRHQFCNYIHDCHDLTLDPYFSSHFKKHQSNHSDTSIITHYSNPSYISLTHHTSLNPLFSISKSYLFQHISYLLSWQHFHLSTQYFRFRYSYLRIRSQYIRFNSTYFRLRCQYLLHISSYRAFRIISTLIRNLPL